jgi:hypothetical protein
MAASGLKSMVLGYRGSILRHNAGVRGDMDKETYDRLVLGNRFRLSGGGVKALLKNCGTVSDGLGVKLSLRGGGPDNAALTISEHIALKLAPVFGEEFVVEVHRLTEEELEARKLQGAVEYLKRTVPREEVSVAQFFQAHPEFWAKIDLLREILTSELLGETHEDFFKKVGDRVRQGQKVSPE